MRRTFQGRPVASFDPEGLIFAVGVQSEQIKLYDVRSFDKVMAGGQSPHLNQIFIHCLGPLLNFQISHRDWMRLDRNKVQLGRKDDDAHDERGGNQVLHINNDQHTRLLTDNIFSGSLMHMRGNPCSL